MFSDRHLKYYEYLRDEVEREDNITNHRLTWAMAFQGFLVTAMTFLLSGSWEHLPPEIETFRKLVVGIIGIVGIVAALLSAAGVDASRHALDQVISDWEALECQIHIIPKLAPRTYGGGSPYRWGSLYARIIPRLFVGMWVLYVGLYAFVVVVKPNLNLVHFSSSAHYESLIWNWNWDWAYQLPPQPHSFLQDAQTPTLEEKAVNP